MEVTGSWAVKNGAPRAARNTGAFIIGTGDRQIFKDATRVLSIQSFLKLFVEFRDIPVTGGEVFNVI